MSETVTSFYSFRNGRPARSSEMNTNFINFKGDVLPINTDTETSSHQTHNVGSSDYRWTGLYCNNFYFTANTLTNNFQIEANRIDTTGSLKILYSSVESYNLRPYKNVTCTAVFSQSIVGATSGWGLISGSTLTIQAHGRPVAFLIFPGPAETTSSFYGITMHTTTFATPPQIVIFKNTITSIVSNFGGFAVSQNYRIPCSRFIDSTAGNTLSTYFIGVKPGENTEGSSYTFIFRNMILCAYDWV